MSASRRDQLNQLLKLYKPKVGQGNYLGDVHWRGGNDMLARVIVVLGLATEDEVKAQFRRLDQDSWERSEAAIARVVARDKART